jgi:hypothetical protein
MSPSWLGREALAEADTGPPPAGLDLEMVGDGGDDREAASVHRGQARTLKAGFETAGVGHLHAESLPARLDREPEAVVLEGRTVLDRVRHRLGRGKQKVPEPAWPESDVGRRLPHKRPSH